MDRDQLHKRIEDKLEEILPLVNIAKKKWNHVLEWIWMTVYNLWYVYEKDLNYYGVGSSNLNKSITIKLPHKERENRCIATRSWIKTIEYISDIPSMSELLTEEEMKQVQDVIDMFKYHIK